MFYTEWNEPLDVDDITNIQPKIGTLANSLAELADIIRAVEKNVQVEFDSEKTKRLISLAKNSARKLKPIIQFFNTEQEAENFYDDLCESFRFCYADVGLYAIWKGDNGKAESIAKKLEKWHELWLLTGKDIKAGGRKKMDGREQSVIEIKNFIKIPKNLPTINQWAWLVDRFNFPYTGKKTRRGEALKSYIKCYHRGLYNRLQ